jgi:hypothetical protein
VDCSSPDGIGALEMFHNLSNAPFSTNPLSTRVEVSHIGEKSTDDFHHLTILGNGIY